MLKLRQTCEFCNSFYPSFLSTRPQSSTIIIIIIVTISIIIIIMIASRPLFPSPQEMATSLSQAFDPSELILQGDDDDDDDDGDDDDYDDGDDEERCTICY